MGNDKKNKKIFIWLFAVSLLFISGICSSSLAKNSNLQKGQINVNSKNIKINGNIYSTNKMNFLHQTHQTVLLPNGKVLIYDLNPELFNPDNNTYTKLPKRNYIITKHTKRFEVMEDGNVLFADPNIVYASSHAIEDNKKHCLLELFDYRTNSFKEFQPNFPYPLKETKEADADKLRIHILSPKLILLQYRKYIPISEDKRKRVYEYYIYDYSNDSYKKVVNGTDKLDLVWTSKNNILYTKLHFRQGAEKYQNNWFIVKYNEDTNSFETLSELDTLPIDSRNLIFCNDKIYFFANVVFPDTSRKTREGSHPSPVYEFDLNTKKLNKIGSLYNGGKVESIVLQDGSILFNSGIFKGPYLNLEIYNPKTNTSVFTKPMIWHRDGMRMTLLNDGSVLLTGGYLKFDLRDETYTKGSNDSYRLYIKY